MSSSSSYSYKNRRMLKDNRMTGGYKTAARKYARSSRSRPARKIFVKAVNEPGFVDVASANYNLDSTGSIVLLNTVAQGAGTSQRIGKKIELKSLQCRGRVVNNTAATFNDCAILIVYDKRPTGTLPQITDILNSATATSFNNDQNSGRFRILKRLDFTLSGNSTALTDTTIVSPDFFLNLRALPTVFKAAGTGAIGDQEQGSLILVTVGINAAGTSAATATLGFRVRYQDV